MQNTVTLSALESEGLVPEQWISMFVSGSVVRGWGNRRSDIDIYVITEHPYRDEAVDARLVALRPPLVPLEPTYVGERRWELEYWHLAQLEQLFEKISWESLQERGPAGGTLTDAEISFLDRLSFGLPIPQADDDGWLRERQRWLNESAFGPILVAKKLAKADNCQEDVLGQLEVGDVVSATLSAQAAFRATIDALLASRGRLTPVEKWRARQLREVDPPEMPFDAYWAIETMRGYDPVDPELWIRGTLELCQDLQSGIAVA